MVDVDEPHAGPGQIRVAVRAAGVNPVDWKIRSGAMQQYMPVQLPYVPGSDVAGVVDEAGRGVGRRGRRGGRGVRVRSRRRVRRVCRAGAFRRQAGRDELGGGGRVASRGRDRGAHTELA
ncbi:MAG: alcohol dehydrogenase catalytic domain-containing protein [Jiangellaceae bacterium]